MRRDLVTACVGGIAFHVHKPPICCLVLYTERRTPDRPRISMRSAVIGQRLMRGGEADREKGGPHYL